MNGQKKSASPTLFLTVPKLKCISWLFKIIKSNRDGVAYKNVSSTPTTADESKNKTSLGRVYINNSTAYSI